MLLSSLTLGVALAQTVGVGAGVGRGSSSAFRLADLLEQTRPDASSAATASGGSPAAAPGMGLAAPVGSSGSSGSSITTPESRLSLVAGQGQLGLLIEHQPHWHSYWINPGDSGLPTSVQWRNLPAGLTLGPIQWPIPKRFAIGPLANYGFDGRVLLPVPVHISDPHALQQAALTGVVTVQAQVSWLPCNQVCIPRTGHLQLSVPIAALRAVDVAQQSGAHVADFAHAAQAQPQTLAAHVKNSARILAPVAPSTGSQRGAAPFGALALRVHGLPPELHGQTLDIFPLQTGLFATGAPQMQSWGKDAQGEGVWQAELPLAEFRSGQAATIDLLLVSGDAVGQRRRGLQLRLPVSGTWPDRPSDALAAPATSEPATSNDAQLAAGASATPLAAGPAHLTPPAMAPRPRADYSFWLILLFAALGGVILNLMPCVFPILAIKVLSFAQHYAAAPRFRVHPSWFYALGVVLSFALLAVLMLLLRSAGAALGWGFQLQSPYMVLFLMLLFTLLSLQFLGLLSMGVPTRWNQFLAWPVRHPALEQFSAGVLAVLVASPCTGPFMGVALGATLTMPAAQAVLVFVVLGLGMAWPYVTLGHFPKLLRWLPKPGKWMERLRQIMAIPLILTVLWLGWVLWQQLGAANASAASPAAAAQTSVAPNQALAVQPVVWQAWSPEREQAALAQGKTVFVNYTAAWCITCQINERLVLQRQLAQDALRQPHVVALKADWTRYDATITASLERFGRSGVPLYVVLKAGQAPQLLPQILDAATVLNAVALP